MNISGYLLVLIINVFFVSISSSQPDPDYGRLPLVETYFESKNFGFIGGPGGSSHYNWVLTILDEVVKRGHNATLFTTDDSLRFGAPFPRIQSVSYGPELKIPKDTRFKSLNQSSSIPARYFIFDLLSRTWERDFITLVELVQERHIDVMLCDHLTDVCADVAKYLKKPFVITCAMEHTKETAASHVYNHQVDVEDFTAEFRTIYDRFLIEFVKPLKVYFSIRKFVNDYKMKKSSLGITGIFDFTESWKDSLRLVNNFYGITPPRRSSPLVEYVGVIIPTSYTPLNEKLKEYLGNHLHVTYVAFGQHARADRNTNTHILSSLLDVFESGATDGILWSTSSPMKDFPDEVVTSSNNTYIVSDLFEGKHPDIRFEKWVPQFAVLLHPSSHLFVSHGGLGSLSEALYAGKRMAFLPFFGDQPGNSKTLERANVGRIIHPDGSIQETTKILTELVVDKNGLVAENLKRMQAIIQIKARDGPGAGATILEEVAFTSVDGKIPHRYEASRRMPFIKLHKIDIYAIFILLVSTLIVGVGYTVKKSINYAKSFYSRQIKIKTI